MDGLVWFNSKFNDSLFKASKFTSISKEILNRCIDEF